MSFKNNTAELHFDDARFGKFHIQKMSGQIDQPLSSPHADLKFHLRGRLQDHLRELPKTGPGLSQKALNEVVQQLKLAGAKE